MIYLEMSGLADNQQIYEPEFRLVLIIVTIVLGTVGFFGFVNYPGFVA